MESDKAKRLIELQSCVTYFLDLYADEAESIDDAGEKSATKRRIAEVIGLNFTNGILPIIEQHGHLNPYPGSGTADWFIRARSKWLKSPHA